jgi:hypothetical protein
MYDDAEGPLLTCWRAYPRQTLHHAATQEWRWCHKCKRGKPPLSHHCSICNTCVLKMVSPASTAAIGRQSDAPGCADAWGHNGISPRSLVCPCHAGSSCGLETRGRRHDQTRTRHAAAHDRSHESWGCCVPRHKRGTNGDEPGRTGPAALHQPATVRPRLYMSRAPFRCPAPHGFATLPALSGPVPVSASHS